VQATPAAAGIDLANWNWKVVRQFVKERFGRVLGRSICWNYLRRLGFVVKRPKKRLLKANAEKRTAFVAAYVALRAEAQASAAKIFFVDEAHLRADVELRAKWVLRGRCLLPSGLLAHSLGRYPSPISSNGPPFKRPKSLSD
jgi:hypothetical protein